VTTIALFGVILAARASLAGEGRGHRASLAR
jgi:hypothetical protein